VQFWRAAARQGNGRARTQLENNFSGWDHFTKVSLPDWIEDNKRNRPLLYLGLSYLGLSSDD
jgi:hypothetical protein